jgi:hypothetical protein
MRLSRRLPLAAALLAAVWSAALAQSGWGLDQLMQSLRAVPQASARFTERKYMSILDAPLESSGTLSYVAPDRIEKITRAPRRESLVVRQDRLTITADGNRPHTVSLRDHPEIWAFVEAIRGTLAGDLPALERFYEVSLAGGAASWQLLLRPKEQQAKALVASIEIDGGGARLDRIEIREASGDRSVMTVLPDPS